ncbi:MAG: ATP-binding protein [Deltaproteobacteria bacterium]|nr:ATP-binding protein [Deltaproteobacteria bacterium]
MPLPRTITEKIVSCLSNHEIIFLLGTRQTGKTTLTRLVAEASSFKSPEIFFFDFEDKEIRALFDTGSVSALRQILKLEGVNPEISNLLIFDEIQLLSDPANLLKLLHDHFPALKIIATGSSSLRIKHKFSDSLAGRKRIFLIQPLSFDEFLLFKGEERLLNARKLFRQSSGLERLDLSDLIQGYQDAFLRLLEEYLIYGGYPEVVLVEGKIAKIEKLDSIATSYIQKDIREVGNIANLEAYNNLLKYLAVNLGAQFNLTSAQATVGISASTLKKYLELLCETFIVAELPPFFTNKNKEISKSKKIFFHDTGIRNLQIRNFSAVDLRTDIESLYENFVFNVFDRERDLSITNYFYRTQVQTEIDFVVEREANFKVFEVKAGHFSRPVKAMREFAKKYCSPIKEVSQTVINRSHLGQSGEVSFLPLYLL